MYIALNSYFRLTYASHVTKYINQILKSKQKARIRADVDSGVILEPTAGKVGKVNQADLHHVTTATGFAISKVRCQVGRLTTRVVYDEKGTGVEPIRVTRLDVSVEVFESINDGIEQVFPKLKAVVEEELV